MEWENHTLTKAVVRAEVGGNCRIRTNEKVIVQQVDFQSAEGKNLNPLFNFIDPGEPLVKDRSKLPSLSLTESYAIEFATQTGGQYVIVPQ